MTEYRSLIRHMEWADALIWQSVLTVPSFKHDSRMHERLHHFHSTQWAYSQVLRGIPIDIPELNSFSDLRSIGLWARRFYREVPSYIDGLDEAGLRKNVEFPWAAQLTKRFGSAGPATVEESILQLVMHTTHHRGQVAMRVRDAGEKPPVTDFILWIWLRRPAPEWGILETA